jgi:hypothetical protein
MTPRSISQEFPSPRAELIDGDCISRSPLPNPSRRCRNYRREERGRNLLEVRQWSMREREI